MSIILVENWLLGQRQIQSIFIECNKTSYFINNKYINLHDFIVSISVMSAEDGNFHFNICYPVNIIC